MGSDQQYNLKWNDFHSSFASSFNLLRNDSDFVDVTIASEGRSFIAHRLVLSACSTYLKKLLKANPCQHPIIILKDVKPTILDSILHFMYNGSVDISQSLLSEFLKTAQNLEVKGLSEDTNLSNNPLPIHNINQPSVIQSYSDLSKRIKIRHHSDMTSLGNQVSIRSNDNCENVIESSPFHPEVSQTSESSVTQMKPNPQQLFDSAPETRNINPTSTSPCILPNKSAEHIVFKQEPNDNIDKPSDGSNYTGETSMLNADIETGSNSGHELSNDNSMDFSSGNPSLALNGNQRGRTILNHAAIQFRPFICTYCGNSYKRKHHLVDHVQNIHLDKPCEDWESCNMCEKRFKTRQRLLIHLVQQHGVYQRKKEEILGVSSNPNCT